MSLAAGAALGVVLSAVLFWLIRSLPAAWFDDRALMRPMELPDQEMRDALEEVDRLAPAAPRVAPLPLRWSIDEVRRKIAEGRMPQPPSRPPPPDVPTWSSIERRPPPPAPMIRATIITCDCPRVGGGRLHTHELDGNGNLKPEPPPCRTVKGG